MIIIYVKYYSDNCKIAVRSGKGRTLCEEVPPTCEKMKKIPHRPEVCAEWKIMDLPDGFSVDRQGDISDEWLRQSPVPGEDCPYEAFLLPSCRIFPPVSPKTAPPRIRTAPRICRGVSVSRRNRAENRTPERGSI